MTFRNPLTHFLSHTQVFHDVLFAAAQSRQGLNLAECTYTLHVPFSQECPQQMNGDVAQGGIILRLYSQAMEIDINLDATSNFQFPGYTFIFDTEQELVSGIPQNLKFIHRFSPISQEVQLQSF